MLVLDASVALQSCFTYIIFFAMFHMKHIVQVKGQVLYKCATREIVDVSISDIPVDSSHIECAFCKLDKTHRRNENSQSVL